MIKTDRLSSEGFIFHIMKYILLLFHVAHMLVTYCSGERNVQSLYALLSNKIISFCLDFKI